jgi:hemolysin activation/secretion protein
MHNNIKSMTPLALALAIAFPVSVLAQQAPDAGRTLQEQQQQPSLPPAQGKAIDIQTQAASPTLPGGQQVVLHNVSFKGNTLFSEEQLIAALGEVKGKSYDLAGLKTLANNISAYYHGQGYPFARAFLPPQALGDGNLQIEVVEGRYGQVQVQGDERAKKFLSALPAGSVIRSNELERTTLLLDDLPGVKIYPVIRPGQEVGTGDLDVRVERTAPITGSIALDNHGNRYTGEYRTQANLQWNSPFLFGDQFNAGLLLSDELMWLSSLSYSLPVGTSGLRAQVGYAHTYYELAKEFDSLDAHGTAKISSAGFSYPLVRSQRSNLTLSTTYQHKELNDKQDVAGTSDSKSSNSLPVTLAFDRRDSFGGGGVTYGSASYTWGDLDLDQGLLSTDRSSGQNTQGNFNKFNLDIARLQALPAGFSLFGRFSGQWADKNLDSSESFSLGGAYGVRAYPSGEGNGDEGWLAQLELRYSAGAFAPYAFYDAGRSTINAKTDGLTTAVTNNHRSIAGAGIGLRYQRNNWNLDASVAWPTQGGDAQSDSANRDPRAWLRLSYNFK